MYPIPWLYAAFAVQRQVISTQTADSYPTCVSVMEIWELDG